MFAAVDAMASRTDGETFQAPTSFPLEAVKTAIMTMAATKAPKRARIPVHGRRVNMPVLHGDDGDKGLYSVVDPGAGTSPSVEGDGLGSVTRDILYPVASMIAVSILREKHVGDCWNVRGF